MSDTSAPARTSRSGLIASLGILAAAMLWFVIHKIHYVSDFSESSYSPYFWPRRLGLLLHLGGGFLAITTGLVQIWLGLTNRVGELHRRLGKVYVAGIALGSTGGVYLVATIPGHFAYAAGLGGLVLAWLVTTGMALLAISRRDIAQHKAWMLRSYTVTFAFVSFRLISDTMRGLVPMPDDPVATDFDAMLAWACWAVPLLVAEVFIQAKAMRRRA